MDQHTRLISLVKKYSHKIENTYGFLPVDELKKKQITNAKKAFAFGVVESDIIGFYDTTLAGNGKKGYLFTDTKVFYSETLEPPKKLWYDDIVEISISNMSKKDCDRSLHFALSDGTTVTWDSCFLNKTPLKEFFIKLLEIVKNKDRDSCGEIKEIKKAPTLDDASKAGGVAMGAYGTVNKLFEEEKFHAFQGHGFAAERANDLHDRISGHDAYIVGDDNVKDGADRILDGVSIQSKYYSDGASCIRACFEEDGKGAFRYFTADGKPMQIEVPADKYDAAVKAMEKKILNGQVNGICDPAEAAKIVKKGNFTYNQAKNIAKAGTVESVIYDATSGAVIATTALGISAVLSFAVSIWNGDELNTALKSAAYSGIKVGGTAFVTSILAGQLTKAGLNSVMVSSSESFIHILGPKASAVLINAFRNGSNIYGAAAMRSAAKLLRSNVITSGATIVVLSTVDVVDIFRKRISGKQLLKNFAATTSMVVGGGAGWLGGATIGSAILPGVGTIVGGLAGAILAGNTAQKVADNITDMFAESDAKEMSRILETEFSKLAEEYMLNKKEAEKVADKLQERLDAKALKEMFSSEDREEYARDRIVVLIECEVSKREHIANLTSEQIGLGLQLVLEDISESE